MAATVVSMKWAGVQSPAAPQMLKTKFLMSSRPERRVVHLGMELHGPDAALLVGDAGQRVCADRGAMKAGGKLLALHRRGSSRQRELAACLQTAALALSSMVTSAWPYSRFGAGAHLAAEMMDDEVQPIADAENGHAQS